jgi:16S rRNA processing protein RimM
VVVESLSDRPRLRFAPGQVLRLENGATLTVGNLEASGPLPRLTFVEIGDRHGAEELRGRLLYIDRERLRPLAPDEFWPEDLAGLEVRSRDGALLGRVEGVVLAPSQDRLVVRSPAGTFEVPFVAELVPAVDVEANTVIVDLPEGLIG